MKFKFLLLLCCISSSINAQKGNNTFSPTIKKVETYFTVPTTVNKFEKTLGNYEVVYSDTTRYVGAPMKIDITYENSPKNDILYKVFISCDSLQKINSIRYIIEENDLDVDKSQVFIRQIKSAGYQYDLRQTRLFGAFSGSARKYFFYHPVKKIHVSFFIISDYRYSVEFSK